jgi:protein-S-isoprenylcysteine O-methyltransferase Ste14
MSILSTSALAQPRRLLDVFEQVAVLALYVFFVVRLWPDGRSASGWYPLLLLFSEGLVVVLLILRRPTDRISTSVRDWLVAAAGTFLPLLVSKGGEPIFAPLGPCLILLGLAIHVSAKLSLLRSFGVVAANRGVRVGGVYRLVRHPMYAGYMLTHIGYLLVAPSFWNAAVYAAVWIFLILRIRAEERVLSEDSVYQDFKRRVRYRLMVGVY